MQALRVLFVEDSERDMELNCQALIAAGYALSSLRVQTAGDMAKALENGQWDVVISDYSMPQFSASAAFQTLRKHDADLPFIIVSGAIGEDSAVTLIKAGAADYLSKDRLARLGMSVEHAIEQSSSRKQNRRDEQMIKKQAALLEQTHTAISAQDLHGNMFFWNRAASTVYGWTREEVMDRPAESSIYRCCPTECLERRQNVLERGEWEGEMALKNKNGQKIVVQSRWIVTRGPNGDPEAIFAMDTDITEKKITEAGFMRAQRLENIGKLAGGIAHDLNNILSPVMMCIPLLREEARSATVRTMLDGLETSVRRGAEIVKQVLTFARGSEGERMDIQMRYLVREMAKIMHETFPKSVSIHTECPGDLWLVKGDATQLHQVLLNLCVNARDAMPDGGSLSIIVRNRTLTAEQAVRHPQARAGDYLALKVADSGCGISSDTMERIFDPFFTTKGDKGTGLGLSTVLGIVKSHGGFIDVESAPGEGSRFTVYLPAFQNGLPDISNGKPVPVFMGHGETVLCVDDEEQIRKMIDITLRRFGYRVLLANHGASAVAIFQENRTQIDVMLTDLCMPLMDGWRAIQEIRLLDPLLKIVAMSGQITPEAVEKAKILGIGDIVEKPLGITQLLETLHRLLHEPTPVMASPRSQSGLGDLEPVTHSGTKGSVSQLL